MRIARAELTPKQQNLSQQENAEPHRVSCAELTPKQQNLSQQKMQISIGYRMLP